MGERSMDEKLAKKLRILADAAKYDASCSSSGAPKRKADVGGLGSTDGNGICHAYTPDGRCVSLLKILLTNYCLFDCAYCVNRRSSNVPRAAFTVEEVVRLTVAFYKRNYIEGLFLSSGIVKSADHTMELLLRVAKTLRREHGFQGYIHLKTIPEANPLLVAEARLYADRLSINIELPRDEILAALATEKDSGVIKKAMGGVRLGIEARSEKARKAKPPKFAPAGQSTQLIVGADEATDGEILDRSVGLYGSYGLKRVYYSGYSPIPDSSSRLPPSKPPLMREHRLYQADWLMRVYGFDRDEITLDGGMLDLEVDPKLAAALKARGDFPVDINTADREAMLRVPGLGVRGVDRLIGVRRYKRLTLEDVKRACGGLAKVRPFIVADGWTPGSLLDAENLRGLLPKDPEPAQLDLF